METVTDLDRRFMAACIRYSRRHLGRTGTNPSVGTLIVADEGNGPVIVGRGVTAVGGRPHAETVALAEAGERARGATAYVTLEPCAHHGRTPPCAEALVAPASRASSPRRPIRTSAFPARATTSCGRLASRSCPACSPTRRAPGSVRLLDSISKKRCQVTLKLAVSADGMIGRGAGQVPITGDVARAQSHVLRAEHDAILVGIGTALADDPELTCRLPGLGERSPMRIVLDSHARLPLTSRLVQSDFRGAACRRDGRAGIRGGAACSKARARG
jgi:diaminohydroxyphosphoribosylaminopyrimidine deaminase/5-amino-6-(5-phosphoribosylamino)uracil reductase